MDRTRNRHVANDVESRNEGSLVDNNNNVMRDILKSFQNIKKGAKQIKEKLQISNQTGQEIESSIGLSLNKILDTMKNLNKVLASNSGLFCYLLLFVMLVFFLLYWIL